MTSGITLDQINLSHALSRLADEGELRQPELYSAGLTLVEPVDGWSRLALALSERVNVGQFWPGSNGLAWRNGNVTCWMTTRESLPVILEARDNLHKLTGESDLPWSIPSLGRRGMRWLGLRQEDKQGRSDLLLEGAGYHYHRVRPGRYHRLFYWDLKSAFFHLLDRLPSPYLFVEDDRATFFALDKEEAVKWGQYKDAFRPLKALRNAAIGSAGGQGNTTYFCNGVKFPSHPSSGPLPFAAKLVVYTCYALTGIAAERNRALYSNTDCVITTQDKPPLEWTSRDLPVELKAYGRAHICHICVYKVGHYATKPYKYQRSRFIDSDFTDSPQVNNHIYHWIDR